MTWTPFDVMKLASRFSFLALLALLAAGCAADQGPGHVLTAEQARARALKLANLKALEMYDHQPFRDGPPARFERGRWVWFARQGYGQGDIEVTVELAADGSTNHVDLKLLANRQDPS